LTGKAWPVPARHGGNPLPPLAEPAGTLRSSKPLPLGEDGAEGFLLPISCANADLHAVMVHFAILASSLLLLWCYPIVRRLPATQLV
jgi:hypothetical protein